MWWQRELNVPATNSRSDRVASIRPHRHCIFYTRTRVLTFTTFEIHHSLSLEFLYEIRFQNLRFGVFRYRKQSAVKMKQISVNYSICIATHSNLLAKILNDFIRMGNLRFRKRQVHLEYEKVPQNAPSLEDSVIFIYAVSVWYVNLIRWTIYRLRCFRLYINLSKGTHINRSMYVVNVAEVYKSKRLDNRQ